VRTAGIRPGGAQAEGQNELGLRQAARQHRRIALPGVPKHVIIGLGEAVRANRALIVFAIQKERKIILQRYSSSILPWVDIFNLAVQMGDGAQLALPVAVIAVVQQVRAVRELQINAGINLFRHQQVELTGAVPRWVGERLRPVFQQRQQKSRVDAVIFSEPQKQIRRVLILRLDVRAVLFIPARAGFNIGAQVKANQVGTVDEGGIRNNLIGSAPQGFVVNRHLHREARRQCGGGFGYLGVCPQDFLYRCPKTCGEQQQGIAALGGIIHQRPRGVDRARGERRGGRLFGFLGLLRGRQDIGRSSLRACAGK